MAPVAVHEDGELAEDAVLKLRGLIAAFSGLGLRVLALLFVLRHLLLAGLLARCLALIASIGHALLLGLLCVVQTLLRLLALLLTGLLLLLLAVL